MMGAGEREGDLGLRVGVSGAAGRMGSTTCAAIVADPELVLAAAVDPALDSTRQAAEVAERSSTQTRIFRDLETALCEQALDVVVDFSTPDTVKANVLTCVRHRVASVVGTTGLGAGDLAELRREAENEGVPVLIAPNFAMGAVLMMRFAELAAEHLQACEIVELHHEAKIDAPSGTSRLTRLRIEESWRGRGLEKEVPIHSVRLPGLVAHQEVIFGGLGETLTIRHDSLSRESFMPGVVLAVKRVGTLQGLVVGLENIL